MSWVWVADGGGERKEDVVPAGSFHVGFRVGVYEQAETCEVVLWRFELHAALSQHTLCIQPNIR